MALYSMPRRVIVAIDVDIPFNGEDLEDAAFCAKTSPPDISLLLRLHERGRASMTIMSDVVETKRARKIAKEDRGW